MQAVLWHIRNSSSTLAHGCDNHMHIRHSMVSGNVHAAFACMR
jgi:hypothetical protein